MLPLLGAAALHSGVTKSIHQRRPVERGVGGVGQSGWPRTEGGVGHKPDLQKNHLFWPDKAFFGPQTIFFWRFCSSYWSPTPLPPSRISIYFSVRIANFFAFRTFLLSIRSGRPRWGGGGVSTKRTMLDRGGGPKSLFLVGRL